MYTACLSSLPLLPFLLLSFVVVHFVFCFFTRCACLLLGSKGRREYCCVSIYTTERREKRGSCPSIEARISSYRAAAT